jgi:AraC-like DNA-binding protein
MLAPRRRHGFFSTDVAPCPAPVYAEARLIVHQLQEGLVDALEVEETAISMLRQTLQTNAARVHAWPLTSRFRVEHVKELISRHLAQPLSTREIATGANTSVYHLCKIFRQITGYSMQLFRRELRLRNSLDLIAGGQDFLQTAIDLGFCSHSHFTRNFRQAFGMQPSEFRRMLGERGSRLLTQLRAACSTMARFVSD